ncbi:MAG: universal stress protein UspA [Hyphomicrobiales bacterium]|nr:MAG: universal stress protein UspA [Hyphomicrobiales bacterium]
MYKNILVSIDLNHESSWTKALPVAASMAKSMGASLHAVTVVPDFGMSIVGNYFPKDFEKQALVDAAEKLKSFVASHVDKSVPVKVHVGHGTIYEEIIHVADKTNCDLIVVGSHRPELQDYLLGPNAARVVRHAKQSVLVVRD